MGLNSRVWITNGYTPSRWAAVWLKPNLRCQLSSAWYHVHTNVYMDPLLFHTRWKKSIIAATVSHWTPSFAYNNYCPPKNPMDGNWVVVGLSVMQLDVRQFIFISDRCRVSAQWIAVNSLRNNYFLPVTKVSYFNMSYQWLCVFCIIAPVSTEEHFIVLLLHFIFTFRKYSLVRSHFPWHNSTISHVLRLLLGQCNTALILPLIIF